MKGKLPAWGKQRGVPGGCWLPGALPRSLGAPLRSCFRFSLSSPLKENNAQPAPSTGLAPQPLPRPGAGCCEHRPPYGLALKTPACGRASRRAWHARPSALSWAAERRAWARARRWAPAEGCSRGRCWWRSPPLIFPGGGERRALAGFAAFHVLVIVDLGLGQWLFHQALQRHRGPRLQA